MEMLAECPPSVAAWNDSGTAFVVKNVSALERQVLPKYFKHSHFASFTRQLRFYGFEKIKHQDGNNATITWEFSHPKFLRACPGKMDAIRRKTCTDPTPKWNVEEVTELREDLSTLQDKMTSLLAHVSTLAEALRGMSQDFVEADRAAPTMTLLMQAAPKSIDFEMDCFDDVSWLSDMTILEDSSIAFFAC
ncbi:Aste57867_590 [Aphanomyces stellatus]|uniref:Aste57867_590 protein n=1 Tax=Aphanomyces stellatus TaxID=120398 RepID=A0A485K470_9STRA|nr:hypothetical protein As57867_000589 [Aphanomyces stellatus]VFT77815.1 Aste57867_590 [Aphanomyces stellatus]